jgi:predicted ester cyclase
MSICFNCGRLMPKDSKYCPECKAEANDQFNRVFKCIRENISKTPIYLIMAYCGISREQAFSYLEKLKAMRYITGNIREGYSITAAGAGIFKEKEQGKRISLEENKAIVRKAIEALNKQDLSLLDDLVAPNYFDHIVKQDLIIVKKSLAMLHKGFPDYNFTIEDMIAEGDKVCARVTFTGTHAGEYLGFAPTGKKVSYKSVTITHVVDGKIVEGWTVNDLLDSFKQIGAIEPTEKGKKLFPDN